jgi:hypothetical protein
LPPCYRAKRPGQIKPNQLIFHQNPLGMLIANFNQLLTISDFRNQTMREPYMAALNNSPEQLT